MDSYSNNFSMQGAKALQAYMDELSEDLGENISFDPIAWCVEWSEYDSLNDFNSQYWGDEDKSHYFDMDELYEETSVIELNNGHILVREF